jgi:hypothetical protein
MTTRPQEAVNIQLLSNYFTDILMRWGFLGLTALHSVALKASYTLDVFQNSISWEVNVLKAVSAYSWDTGYVIWFGAADSRVTVQPKIIAWESSHTHIFLLEIHNLRFRTAICMIHLAIRVQKYSIWWMWWCSPAGKWYLIRVFLHFPF